MESSSHNNSLHNVGEIIAFRYPPNNPAQIGKIQKIEENQIIVLPAKRKEKPNSDYAYHFDPKDESPGISFESPVTLTTKGKINRKSKNYSYLQSSQLVSISFFFEGLKEAG